MATTISVRDLKKTYASGPPALKGVSLEIEEGEILALLGPNGAGKTTLISIICGIATLSSGSVTVGGHDVINEYRAARRLIGLVPQEITLEPFEKVQNTVRLSRGLFGLPRNDAYIEDVLRKLSLWDKRNAPITRAVGRHEAPGADRQGAEPRAARAVSGRTHRRRGRGTAQGHVEDRARSAGQTASRSS